MYTHMFTPCWQSTSWRCRAWRVQPYPASDPGLRWWAALLLEWPYPAHTHAHTQTCEIEIVLRMAMSCTYIHTNTKNKQSETHVTLGLDRLLWCTYVVLAYTTHTQSHPHVHSLKRIHAHTHKHTHDTWRFALRLSPNPGALTQHTLRPPRSLFTMNPARASLSTSKICQNLVPHLFFKINLE